MSITRSCEEGQSGKKSSCVIHFEAIKYYVSHLKFFKGVRGFTNNAEVVMSGHVLCAKSTLRTPHAHGLFLATDHEAQRLISILRQGNSHREENDLFKVTQQGGS